MIEFLLKILTYFFVEIIFEGVFKRIFKGVYLLGILVLKLITFSGQSTYELKHQYKDSSKPYFLGFGLISGIIYLIIYLLN